MTFRPHPDCQLAVRGNLHVLTILLVAPHLAQQAGSAVLDIGGPHLLFGLLQLAGRIGHVPVAADLRTARIDRGFAVRRKAERNDALAVVALVSCHLTRREAGSIGDPDVALALAVEDPGNSIGLGCRGQSRREGRAHHLFQRELWALGACCERG